MQRQRALCLPAIESERDVLELRHAVSQGDAHRQVGHLEPVGDAPLRAQRSVGLEHPRERRGDGAGGEFRGARGGDEPRRGGARRGSRSRKRKNRSHDLVRVQKRRRKLERRRGSRRSGHGVETPLHHRSLQTRRPRESDPRGFRRDVRHPSGRLDAQRSDGRVERADVQGAAGGETQAARQPDTGDERLPVLAHGQVLDHDRSHVDLASQERTPRDVDRRGTRLDEERTRRRTCQGLSDPEAFGAKG